MYKRQGLGEVLSTLLTNFVANPVSSLMSGNYKMCIRDRECYDMKTVKAVVAKYNQTSLILRILIGLAVGSVLALVAPGAGWVGELGSLFVGALKGIAPVLVFVIVASALAQLSLIHI